MASSILPTNVLNHNGPTSISVDETLSSHRLVTPHAAVLGWGGVVCLATFVVDVLTMRGVTVAFLYVVAILLSLWSGQRRAVIAFTVLGTVLTIVAAFLKSPGVSPDVMLSNRFMTLILLWSTAFLGLRNQKVLLSITTKSHLHRLNDELKSELSERRRVEETLRRSEKELAEAQEISLVGSWNWDVRQNKLTGSDELFRIYGLAPGAGGSTSVSYEAFLQAVHPLDRETVRQIIDDTIRTQEQFRFHYRIVRPDGNVRWLQARGQVELDPTGGAIRIYGTGQDITELKLAEEELEQSRQHLQALSAHLQSVREEERKRIAREIHDELGQALTAFKMDLTWLSKQSQNDAITAKVRSMTVLVNETIQTVRRIATELRPAILDDLGLPAALEWQAQEFEKRTGVSCDLRISNEVKVGAVASTELFRIFQEILTNIARHAHATKVHVTLEKQTDQLMLEVRDNGVGIRQSQVSDIRSIGLTGMRERVRLLGGEVLIAGVAGQGTTVVVQVPVEQCEEDRPVLPAL
jgi:PAS domain S-box-containing protein